VIKEAQSSKQRGVTGEGERKKVQRRPQVYRTKAAKGASRTLEKEKKRGNAASRLGRGGKSRKKEVAPQGVFALFTHTKEKKNRKSSTNRALEKALEEAQKGSRLPDSRSGKKDALRPELT